MSLRLKICGITNLEDANAAIEAGADALGFMFFPASRRYILPAAARQIICSLPPFLSLTGVFVDASQTEVFDIIKATGINTLQFHGEEDANYCASFPLPVIKAVRVKDSSSLETLREHNPSAFLLDAWTPGERGGTGEIFNWDLAVQAKRFGKPIILAGGLTPANVESAVRQTRPFAVDVSSGVEIAPGKKDARKMRDFISRAKSA